MNQEAFQRHVAGILSLSTQLLNTKGTEYAGSLDRLANFKRGAELTGATPLQVAFIYMAKHFDAIATYVRAESAADPLVLTESIESRFCDLINYAILMSAIVAEQHQPLPPEVR